MLAPSWCLEAAGVNPIETCSCKLRRADVSLGTQKSYAQSSEQSFIVRSCIISSPSHDSVHSMFADFKIGDRVMGVFGTT